MNNKQAKRLRREAIEEVGVVPTTYTWEIRNPLKPLGVTHRVSSECTRYKYNQLKKVYGNG